jgi:hypothetical protein
MSVHLASPKFGSNVKYSYPVLLLLWKPNAFGDVSNIKIKDYGPS